MIVHHDGIIRGIVRTKDSPAGIHIYAHNTTEDSDQTALLVGDAGVIVVRLQILRFNDIAITHMP